MEEGREKPGAASKPPRVKNNRQTPRAQAVLFPYCGSTSMGAFFAAARSRLRPRHQRDRLCAVSYTHLDVYKRQCIHRLIREHGVGRHIQQQRREFGRRFRAQRR